MGDDRLGISGCTLTRRTTLTPPAMRHAADGTAQSAHDIWQHREESANRLRCRSPWQRNPYVSVRKCSHRGEHVTRLLGVGRARAARRHRESGLVQLDHQRLAVEVQARERDDVRQAVHRVAVHDGVGHQRGHPVPDQAGQLAQRGVGGASSACAASSAAAAATIAGRLGKPGTRCPSRLSAGSGGFQRTALRTARTPTPGGPPHLWPLAVSSDQPSGSGIRPADAAASTKSGTRRWRTPGDLGDRLDRADLVVGRLQAGEHGPVVPEGRGERGDVDPAVRFDAHDRDLAARASACAAAFSTLECSTALTTTWPGPRVADCRPSTRRAPPGARPGSLSW